MEVSQSAAVFVTPDTWTDWVDCNDVGKLISITAVYDWTETNDCSDCDDSRAAGPSMTLDADVSPTVMGTSDKLKDWVDCNDVDHLVLLAA